MRLITQIGFSRIDVVTQLSFEFPARTRLNYLSFIAETTGVYTGGVEVILNSGTGNSVSWIPSNFASFNYNAFRLGALNANQFKVDLDMDVYSFTVNNVGTTIIQVILNFSINPAMYDIFFTRSRKYTVHN